eukprot:06212_1
MYWNISLISWDRGGLHNRPGCTQFCETLARHRHPRRKYHQHRAGSLESWTVVSLHLLDPQDPQDPNVAFWLLACNRRRVIVVISRTFVIM